MKFIFSFFSVVVNLISSSFVSKTSVKIKKNNKQKLFCTIVKEKQKYFYIMRISVFLKTSSSCIWTESWNSKDHKTPNCSRSARNGEMLFWGRQWFLSPWILILLYYILIILDNYYFFICSDEFCNMTFATETASLSSSQWRIFLLVLQFPKSKS